MGHSGTHDGALVVLSILIAVLASYTALDLAGRMRASTGLYRYAWLGSAAVAMGGGIWSMHFVAMLAFSIPDIPFSYDLTLTLVSLALPVVVTAFGFLVSSRAGATPMVLGFGGLVMGLGIAGMHYAGMAAIRMAATLTYVPAWIVISILIAIGASAVALWLASRQTGWPERVGAALVMGLAVSGMHYSAMYGAVITPSAEARTSVAASVGQTHLAIWIASTTFLILILALIAAMFDRHFAHAAAREAAALRASEERFRLLVQSVRDYAIFMLDTEGRIANWNSGAERIKGYRENEIVGSHMSRFYTQEDQAAGVPFAALETARREGKFEAEGWRVRKDGTRFWASVLIDAIHGPNGEPLGFAKVTRDITERKQAGEALEATRQALAQAQKMEAIGQLTGGVAHDFNNLLMAVLGSLELLRKRLPPDPRAERLLDNAVQGAQRGAALTQRMLAFARRQNLNPRPLDVAALVDGMDELLTRSIGPAIEIATRFPPGLPRAVADAHQLELGLLNLVVNARDAMPAGGTITISARAASGGGETGLQPGPYLCLSVTDTGEGMDEETLARAHEPFFTTKGVGKGTGLGLSMVHGLAEQSRGKLVIVSRKGVGTTAEIWLPAVDGQAEPQAADAAPAPVATGGGRRLRILLVDDDPLVLENAAAMLEDLGHTVIPARSGPEALSVLGQGVEPDIVITDHAMPGMTGLQLVERIRTASLDLPVILATGYAELAPEACSGLQRLQKPFSQADIAQAIDGLLS